MIQYTGFLILKKTLTFYLSHNNYDSSSHYYCFYYYYYLCYLLRSRKHRPQYKITENETTTYTYSFRSVRLYWGHCCASNSQDMNSMQSLRQLRLKPDAPLNPAGSAHAKEWVVACTKQKPRMVHISTKLRTYQGALVRLLPTRAGRSTTSHGQHSYGEGKKGKEKLLLPHQNLMIKVKARRFFPPTHTHKAAPRWLHVIRRFPRVPRWKTDDLPKSESDGKWNATRCWALLLEMLRSGGVALPAVPTFWSVNQRRRVK